MVDDLSRGLAGQGTHAGEVLNQTDHQREHRDDGGEESNAREREAAAVRAEALAHWLDESIPLPGGIKIGFDGLLGLIPGLGDAASALVSFYIIWLARKAGAPDGAQVRMLINLGLDALVGAVPLLGDFFDFAYKANMRNVRLMRQSMGVGERPVDAPGAPGGNLSGGDGRSGAAPNPPGLPTRVSPTSERDDR